MKAAIFDLDGTLVDSMGVWGQINREFLTGRGFEYPDDLPEIVKKMSFAESAAYHIQRFALGETPEELIAEWNRMAARAYAETLELKEGARELLEGLKTKGVKLALATATERALAESALKRLEVLAWFQVITTVGEVGLNKDDPGFFLKVAEKLGVAPGDCVVVEDSLHAVKGAKLAGMTVWAVYDAASAHERAEMAKIADRYVESLSELTEDD